MGTLRTVELPDRSVRIEIIVEGDAPRVVLVPSANRGARDFDDLAIRLRDAGYGSVAVNLRGIGKSTGPMDEVSLRDLADDVVGLIDDVIGKPADLVGHAFGNTVVRAVAAYHPDRVRSVSLLAAGGHTAMDRVDPVWLGHFERCRRFDLDPGERLESIGHAFFAPGNDPGPWLEGWWPDRLGLAEVLARSDPEEWKAAGSAPVLIVQPLDDIPGPPEIGRGLRDLLGPRATYVELAHCGHAILPEQPGAVADAVVGFLNRVCSLEESPRSGSESH